MTDKELKRLSRAELLELLLMQTRESEHLKMQLEEAKRELADREIRIREAGNLADATLAVNGVLESAQKAAQQYLDNIARMEQETKLRCQQMLLDASGEAEKIKLEAAENPRVVIYRAEQTKPAEQPEIFTPEAPKEHPVLAFAKELREQARKVLCKLT